MYQMKGSRQNGKIVCQLDSSFQIRRNIRYQLTMSITKDLIIMGGTSHPGLVERIAKNIGVEPSKAESARFSNGETQVVIKESVREKDVYVIQSACGGTNDSFIELLIMISACKTASAAKVTAVLPLFPYSRQPDLPFKNHVFYKTDITEENYPHTKNLEKVPISTNNKNHLWISQAGTLVASLLTGAGADHIITMDLHDPQFQGFFDIPVDNLYGKPLVQQYIRQNIPEYENAVIVSPDAGGAKRASAVADSLGMPFALIHKERQQSAVDSDTHMTSSLLVGDVEGRVAIIVDDIIDTGKTVTGAARLLRDEGAITVYAVATHGILSEDASSKIKDSLIDHVVVTNSTPQESHGEILGDKLKVLDVSRVFGEAIRRIHNGESVSMLFDHAL